MSALVIGANGYLGSHVTRQLVDAGEDVRVMVRDGANTRGIQDLIDDLTVTRFVGDIFDGEVLRAAMTGCDVVYYCVVDTRGWLRDPAPLFRTNVEGTRHVLDVAVEPAIATGLKKFVFTSTYAAVARRRGHTATEDDVGYAGGRGAFLIPEIQKSPPRRSVGDFCCGRIRLAPTPP